MIVYDKGSFGGRLENLELCVAPVSDYSGYHFIQCSRKRGKGKEKDLCWQHAAKEKKYGRESLHIPEDAE